MKGQKLSKYFSNLDVQFSSQAEQLLLRAHGLRLGPTLYLTVTCARPREEAPLQITLGEEEIGEDHLLAALTGSVLL